MPCSEAPDVILYRIGWTFVDSDRGLLLRDRFSQSIRERLNSWTGQTSGSVQDTLLGADVRARLNGTRDVASAKVRVE